MRNSVRASSVSGWPGRLDEFCRADYEAPRIKSGLPTAPAISGREGPPPPGTVDKPRQPEISRRRDRRFAEA